MGKQQMVNRDTDDREDPIEWQPNCNIFVFLKVMTSDPPSFSSCLLYPTWAFGWTMLYLPLFNAFFFIVKRSLFSILFKDRRYSIGYNEFFFKKKMRSHRSTRARCKLRRSVSIGPANFGGSLAGSLCSLKRNGLPSNVFFFVCFFQNFCICLLPITVNVK